VITPARSDRLNRTRTGSDPEPPIVGILRRSNGFRVVIENVTHLWVLRRVGHTSDHVDGNPVPHSTFAEIVDQFTRVAFDQREAASRYAGPSRHASPDTLAGQLATSGGRCAVSDYLPMLLLAVAGFLLGGVWVLWKTAKVVAVVLAVAALLALVGGIAWMM
jgi:hypothetical protein